MKLAGTIKLEIIKPLDTTWDSLGSRLRAISRSLAPALTITMREFYPHAVKELESRWNKEDPDTEWRNRVKGVLRVKWNSELARAFDRDRTWALKNKRPEPDALSYAPIGDAHSGETADHILSRFAGDHLKDLLASRASFPNFVGDKAFYSEGRKCVVEGQPEAAVLRFPLWGTGSRLTALAVAPCGNHAKALWRKLVRDFDRRDEVVAVERALKAEKDKERKKALTARLEEMSVMKLGRVGVKYDDKRHKWYALISWSQNRPDDYKAGQTAAVNLGVNVFLQAMSEDGAPWDCPGSDILVTRERFSARRRSIQRGLKFSGRGARGHGKKRFEQPLTRLDKAEQRWMETKNRTIAAKFGKWCVGQGVSDVLLEDLTGIRDSFEKQTEGDANTRIKRAIHSWSYYNLGKAIERELDGLSVRVHRVSSSMCSQRCPDCGHESRDNVQIVDRGGDYLLVPPSKEVLDDWRRAKADDPAQAFNEPQARVFKSVDKGTRFLCVACGCKGKGDLVTCANMLLNAGKRNPLGKMQEAAKKRAVAKIKTRKGDKK